MAFLAGGSPLLESPCRCKPGVWSVAPSCCPVTRGPRLGPPAPSLRHAHLQPPPEMGPRWAQAVAPREGPVQLVRWGWRFRNHFLPPVATSALSRFPNPHQQGPPGAGRGSWTSDPLPSPSSISEHKGEGGKATPTSGAPQPTQDAGVGPHWGEQKEPHKRSSGDPAPRPAAGPDRMFTEGAGRRAERLRAGRGRGGSGRDKEGWRGLRQEGGVQAGPLPHSQPPEFRGAFAL